MKNFAQVVRHQGNDSLFEIIDISILGTMASMPVHFHAEGFRGTGKTTIIRAAKQILPKIERIKGCEYNCDPQRPHCPHHRHLSAIEIEKLGVELIDMPFLEISPSAKKGTIVGSIDLKKITSKDNPEAALLLGTIPRAHRGIIFVDEINRIADISPEIADILLDVMGTKPGRIQIEEVGLPTVVLPIQASVWAASNPDEEPGPLEDIRRQLSDRFDFAVKVERPMEIAVLKRILDGNSESSFDNKLIEVKKDKFEQTKKKISEVILSEEIKSILASVYVDFGLESLRSIEAITRGAIIKGALMEKSPDIEDIVFLAKCALRHRIDSKNLNDIIKYLEQRRHHIEKKQESLINMAIVESEKESPQQSKKNTIGDSGLLQNRFLNPIEKLLSYLTKKSSASPGDSRITIDPKKIDIKAPSKKAQSIKQLELKDYVKKEEELRK
ncbi:MAG: magnesium chelatase [Tepidanaerobacteraceae bacterium]|jgi:magnesium chelatase subunit I|nr:magnesium chelatase [Tepidanaerobacteraceae bacterium]